MSTGKTRVLFVSNNLAGGGAERVIAILLEHLDRSKFEPCLVLFQDRIEYSVPQDVPVICLQKSGWYDYPKLIWKLSQVCKKWKPDSIFSISRYTNLITILALRICRNNSKLLLSEHSIPSYFLEKHHDPLSVLFEKWMPRWFYRYADKVICVSLQSASDVHRLYGVPDNEIKVLHNPVDEKKIMDLCRENVEHPWFKEDKPVIVSMGSLIEVKGYPYLLRAFSKLLSKYSGYLVILGKGNQENFLRDLAKQLGIEKHVAFLGFQDNPFKYISRSNLFVLSSLSEAFPMAILEAMTCGVPVVSTQSPGSNEIIIHGFNGLLVPIADENALAEAMIKVIYDKSLAHNLAEEGRKSISEFSLMRIIKAYEELLT